MGMDMEIDVEAIHARGRKMIYPIQVSPLLPVHVSARLGSARPGQIVCGSSSTNIFSHVVLLGLPPASEEGPQLVAEAGRRLGEGGLVGVDLRLLPDEVGVERGNEARALDNLPAKVQQDGDEGHGVRREEVGDAPAAREEDGVAEDALDEDHVDEGDVGAVGLQVADVREGGAVEALGPAGAVEEDVRQADADVVDHGGALGDGLQRGDGGGGAAGDLEEGEEGEDHDDGEGVDGDAVPHGALEEGRGLAVAGEAVEGAHGAVDVGVAGAEDARDQERVDDVRQHGDAHVLHGDDVGRAVGRAGAVVEPGVVVGDHDADGERAEDEEDEEPPVHRLEAVLDVHARPLRLARHHGHVLGPHDGEARREERAQEPLEPAQRARVDVLGEGPRAVPVPEPVGLVLGVPADRRDEGEEEHDEDEQQLAGGEPELRLASESQQPRKIVLFQTSSCVWLVKLTRSIAPREY